MDYNPVNEIWNEVFIHYCIKISFTFLLTGLESGDPNGHSLCFTILDINAVAEFKIWMCQGSKAYNIRIAEKIRSETHEVVIRYFRKSTRITCFLINHQKLCNNSTFSWELNGSFHLSYPDHVWCLLRHHHSPTLRDSVASLSSPSDYHPSQRNKAVSKFSLSKIQKLYKLLWIICVELLKTALFLWF